MKLHPLIHYIVDHAEPGTVVLQCAVCDHSTTGQRPTAHRRMGGHWQEQTRAGDLAHVEVGK